MSESQTTTDHEKIQKWAESRGGHPATVKGTGDGEPGLLRIDFDPQEESLERIDWDAFFEKFDEEGLAFLYQDKTKDGATSRFCKFVSAESVSSSEGP